MVKTFDRSADADLNLPGGYETPEQRIALLEAMVEGMHQEMVQKDSIIEKLQDCAMELERRLEHAGRVRAEGGDEQSNQHMRQLEMALEEKDQQVSRLESALASTEESLFQRANDAETRVQYLQALVDEKEQKITQLQTCLESLSSHGPADNTEQRTDAARNLQRALGAEERALQLGSIVEEKGQIISRLEAEVVMLKTAAQVNGEAAAGNLATQDAEAKVQHFQVLVDAKDKQIAQLEHLLNGMQEEASNRRSAALGQDAFPQLQVMLDQREIEIKRLNEDLAGAKKRAEIAEAGRQELRKELALSTEEVVRLQVALDGKDVHTAQLVEDERRTSGAHKQVIEAEVSRLQTFLAEKDRLIEQLMAAVASNGNENNASAEVAQLTQSFEHEVAQLTKSFEQDKIALREQMTQQFEQEYGALQSQLAQLKRDANAAFAERDNAAMEMRQALMAEEQSAPRRQLSLLEFDGGGRSEVIQVNRAKPEGPAVAPQCEVPASPASYVGPCAARTRPVGPPRAASPPLGTRPPLGQRASSPVSQYRSPAAVVAPSQFVERNAMERNAMERAQALHAGRASASACASPIVPPKGSLVASPGPLGNAGGLTARRPVNGLGHREAPSGEGNSSASAARGAASPLLPMAHGGNEGGSMVSPLRSRPVQAAGEERNAMPLGGDRRPVRMASPVHFRPGLDPGASPNQNYAQGQPLLQPNRVRTDMAQPPFAPPQWAMQQQQQQQQQWQQQVTMAKVVQGGAGQ